MLKNVFTFANNIIFSNYMFYSYKNLNTLKAFKIIGVTTVSKVKWIDLKIRQSQTESFVMWGTTFKDL